MNDIMVDLETMDNVGSSAIMSIGAVQCDLTTGAQGQTFYRVVDLTNQDKLGLTLDVQTVYWWLGQSSSATDALLVSGKVLLEDMCRSFDNWLDSLDGNTRKYRLWGNGASFDNAILRHAYKRIGREFPIPFWQDRDMRTLVGFAPKDFVYDWKIRNPRNGTHHNALDDAQYQVKMCSYILKELGVEELY